MWGMQDPGECQGFDEWWEPVKPANLLIDCQAEWWFCGFPSISCGRVLLYHLRAQDTTCMRQPTNQSICAPQDTCILLRWSKWDAAADPVEIQTSLKPEWRTDRPTHQPIFVLLQGRWSKFWATVVVPWLCFASPQIGTYTPHPFASSLPASCAALLSHLAPCAAPTSHFCIWPQSSSTNPCHLLHSYDIGVVGDFFAPIEPDKSRSRRHLLPLDQTFCCFLQTCQWPGALRRVVY